MGADSMTITEFSDILAYYDEARADRTFSGALGEALEDDGIRTFEDGLDAAIERWKQPLKRWPVRNHEIREPVGSQKRAIIHERDGGRCRYCGIANEQLVVDHIIPRSTFYPHDLRIADRSDNLQSSCWDCNERRSNYESIFTKRIGVVVKCWYCVYPDYEELREEGLVSDPPPEVIVFCGRCGISHVPKLEGWVL